MTNTFRLRRFNFFVQEEIPQLPAVFSEPDLLITSTEGQPGVVLDSSPPPLPTSPPTDGQSGTANSANESGPHHTNKAWTTTTDQQGGFLFLGSVRTNTVHVVDPKFTVRSFAVPAPQDDCRLTHLKCIPEANALITINEFESVVSRPPLIRVWPLDRVFHANYQPVMVTLQYFPVTPFPVTTFDVHPSLGQWAFGFANGLVVLGRGDLGRHHGQLKQKILHEATEPITGLAFTSPPGEGDSNDTANNRRPPPPPSASSPTLLYTTTTSQTLVFNTTHSQREIKTLLDQEGCALRACYTNARGELVVAREEAIYFYSPEGRGPCFAIEGPKVLVRSFKDYVIILTNPDADSQSGLHWLYGASGPTGGDVPTSLVPTPMVSAPNLTLQVLDMRNKLVAFSGNFAAAQVQVISEWGGIFVVVQSPESASTESTELYRLEEKSLTQKLDILYKQNLYPLAIKLATHHRYNQGSISEIYRRYGDYLYSQDDYDGAMDQYLQTVGYVEPSYVIRKFLDAQRLHHLTSYLETLHEQGLATADHTTLLLNCYTKLKDEARLSRFLQQGGTDLQFDVDTAIKVCRQAGYADHALALARRFNQHGVYLEIQIEDIGNLNEAVDYLRHGTFDASERVEYLTRYGQRLLDQLPDQTTQLFIDTCTRIEPNTTPPSPRPFLSVFINHPQNLIQFLETVSKRRWHSGSERTAPNTPASTAADADAGPAEDETLADRKVVWLTLLELHLEEWEHFTRLATSATPSSDSGDSAAGRQTAAKKVMALLQDRDVDYDWDQAFTLCDMVQFDQGTTWLYESRQMYQELFQFYMDRDDVETVLQLLDKLGTKEPSLYTQTLNYIVSSSTTLTTHADELQPLLAKIERLGLLPPLEVVQILSRHSVAKLGLVKEFLLRSLRSERAQADQDQRLIESYREETEAMRQDIRRLQTTPIVFQATQCSSCQTPLDLPAIHFLCRHSYHQRCLGEAEEECPRCATENRMVAEVIRSQEAAAGQHDRFLAKLEDAPEGFDVIAEYFSKGTFSEIGPVDVP
ncbi:Vacuolar protein sorting-associated protein 11 [Dimargaris cristalligena]|uniref:E3 ubiquitin-protein ligase PEP5 n=1 Tax=Dimargaris cristalligena TaxID=215637 RepID=A0A4P9ZLW6_9FUNG|nr:Vacuolar protein sorting-associated protein 11 [Dimargaris cristalligena]RKP34153.1 hypothetical protein BJ085DRAFT_38941 [Dimargaris cristalligena]|eukprot:RKP34153.1 hypothetical protein BJ085DRAFT_38941 [Dimargaris cristalligena]